MSLNPNNGSQQQFISKETGMVGMRRSRIENHNVYQDTDKLYEPLRGVLLHPESTVQPHKGYIPEGARVSHVSHQYHNLNQEEISKMVSVYLFSEPTHGSLKMRIWCPLTIWRKSEAADLWSSMPPRKYLARPSVSTKLNKSGDKARENKKSFMTLLNSSRKLRTSFCTSQQSTRLSKKEEPNTDRRLWRTSRKRWTTNTTCTV